MDPVRQKARQLLYAVALHDIEEQQRLHRAVAAIGYGLDPAPFATPFPGSVTIVNHAPPVQTPPRGWTAGHTVTLLMIVVGLLLAGCAGAVAVMLSGGSPKPMQFEVEWQDENGKWNKMVRPQP